MSIAGREVFQEYFDNWKFGTIVHRAPSELLCRDELRDQVLTKAYADSEFRHELLTNTRLVWAIILEESFNLNRYEMLYGIRSFRALIETPERIYLKLPACHRGCRVGSMTAAPPGHSEASCHICGITFASAKNPCKAEVPVAAPRNRRQIEARIREKCILDPAFKTKLQADPLQTYLRFAEELTGRKCQYVNDSVRELVIVEEGEQDMVFVFPTEESYRLEQPTEVMTPEFVVS